MTDFLQALSYLCGIFAGCFAVSFGLYAGIQAASKALGPINVNFNRTETVRHVHQNEIPEPTL